jgi:hypothetical protein
MVGGVIDRTGARLLLRLGRSRQRQLGHGLGDMAFVNHCRDDLRGAFAGGLRIAVGGELRRRLHQPGEHGRLGQRHGARDVTEIFARRRFDAIGAGAEIDAVEIEFEDLVLGIAMLQPDGQNRLLDLARHRAFLRQEQVFCELLRQRRAALHRLAHEIARQRARDADGVDAEMRIEAPVLDRDEGFRRIGRQLGEMDRRPARIAAIGQQGAVLAENGDIGRALRNRQLVDRRQLRGVIDDESGAADDGPDAGDHAPIAEPAEQRAPTTRPSAGLFRRIPAPAATRHALALLRRIAGRLSRARLSTRARNGTILRRNGDFVLPARRTESRFTAVASPVVFHANGGVGPDATARQRDGALVRP